MTNNDLQNGQHKPNYELGWSTLCL